MGNSSKKMAEKCTLLTREEQKAMAATYRAVSRNSSVIKEDDVTKAWGHLIDPRMTQYIINFLFRADKNGECDFNRFVELYVFNVRGNTDEKVSVIYASLGKDISHELPYQLLKEYCESIVSTYIKMLKTGSIPEAAQWTGKGFRGTAQHVQALGETIATAAIGDTEPAPAALTVDDIAKWVSMEILLSHMSEVVFATLYDMKSSTGSHMIPAPIGLDAMPDYPAFTDLSHIVWLTSHLPAPLQKKWRFLFSTHIHGLSFATMAGRIVDTGPSIVIIEDSNGYIFGGFATDSWKISPNFAGDDRSFLFTLAPKMRIYPATGFNNHYQYLNHHTKTMPNGMLMGGQLNYGGIWISADPYGIGTSADSCTTFKGFRRLSKDPQFNIRSMEVWALGDVPVVDGDLEGGEKSILDKNPEAKAILEMAGKTQHSDGLREPENSSMKRL